MYQHSALVDDLSIVSAQGDLLYTRDGRALVDLFTAHGTVWLGHRHPDVQAAVADQLDRVWITGGMPTPAVGEMRDRLGAFLPAGYRLASLASSGMEANEQALRVARVLSGRNGALGLAGAMHGKSLATAHLAWDNGDGLALPGFHRIAAGPELDEGRMLEEIEDSLRGGELAALFLEPIHGSSLGWEATPGFHQAVLALARRAGTLLVYDEVLTGFYRTGDRFRFLRYGVEPDLIVFGKACGNGFPVAGLAVREDLPLSPRMLLGSTFSNNALAAAAVSATVACLEKLDPARMAAEIECTVRRHLKHLIDAPQPRMRGSGAMWVIALDSEEQARSAAHALHRAGVCIGFHGRQLRMLPPLTIDAARLEQACTAVAALV